MTYTINLPKTELGPRNELVKTACERFLDVSKEVAEDITYIGKIAKDGQTLKKYSYVLARHNEVLRDFINRDKKDSKGELSCVRKCLTSLSDLKSFCVKTVLSGSFR